MKAHILTCIVGESQRHKLHGVLKAIPCISGVSFVGTGTVRGALASLLGIKVERKEIVHILISEEESAAALMLIANDLHLEKKGNGIAYITTTVTANELEEDSMYQKITVITEHGEAEAIMDIARAAGATGGTILHGRGTGGAIATRLFGFEIEPEKDVLIILSPSAIAKEIVAALEENVHFNEPRAGILFVEPILKAIGLPNEQDGDHHTKD